MMVTYWLENYVYDIYTIYIKGKEEETLLINWIDGT